MTRQLKRERRTKAEIEALDAGLVEIVRRNQPATVRQIFYQASVAGLVSKDEKGYGAVQRRLVVLRERGLIPYRYITDNMRIVRGYDRYSGLDAFVQDVAGLYRRDLWAHAYCQLEIWIEKDALASTIAPVVIHEWGLDLHVARGFSSITYLQAAADTIREDGRPAFIYLLTDFDPSGMCLANKVGEELSIRAVGVPVHVERLALNAAQITAWDLPTRPNKKSDSRTKAFERVHGSQSCDLDAVSPNVLRGIVNEAISRHGDREKIAMLKRIEQSERETMIEKLRDKAA